MGGERRPQAESLGPKIFINLFRRREGRRNRHRAGRQVDLDAIAAGVRFVAVLLIVQYDIAFENETIFAFAAHAVGRRLDILAANADAILEARQP